MDSIANKKVKTTKGKGVRLRSLAWNTLGLEGLVRAPKWGLGKVASKSITYTDVHKPNNKLVSAWLKHFWCTNEPGTNTNLQDSPRPKLGGSHHLPPYIILCAWP
jgi:hypothetical protein